MKGVRIEASETRVVSEGFQPAHVRNEGPGPLLIEGETVAVGSGWSPTFAGQHSVVVTAFDEPALVMVAW